MKITNVFDISLPLAVWLLQDDYDYVNEPNYISATSLLRSTKQIILSRRLTSEDVTMDISERIPSALGNSVHDSVDKAWMGGAGKALQKLGYPPNIINNIKVNPSEEYLIEHPATLPVWIQKRAFRQLGKYKIGGKLDMVIDGHLYDYKTTSVWSYIKGDKTDDYALQGSIYRWLNPVIINRDYVYINFVFTDWQRSMVRTNEDYPKLRTQELVVPLLSIEATEKFILDKLNQLDRLWNSPESDLPPCNDKELWRSEPRYKYFSNPDNAKATKNFDSKSEAHAYMAEKGNKGVIKTVPGEVKACSYCPAYSICKQREQYDV